jgi:mannose-1-phosphate guanylyltransferase
MLLESVLRVGGAVAPMAQTIVVTGPDLAETIQAMVGGLGVQVLVEPMAKSTGPCLAWVAAWIAERDRDGVMSVFPADHLVADVAAFRSLASEAASLAETSNRIVTLGIQPDHPATGFGYIRVGAVYSEPASHVAGFVEKPQRPAAEAYLASGDYVWNAGMFFMRVATLLEAVARHQPSWAEALPQAVVDGPGLLRYFEAAESLSVDVAIMEPEGERLLVIPADVGWCDLGSWPALLGYANADSNFVKGQVRLVDVSDSVVHSETTRVTVMGLSNICVVATADEILVADLSRAEDVRGLADQDFGES